MGVGRPAYPPYGAGPGNCLEANNVHGYRRIYLLDSNQLTEKSHLASFAAFHPPCAKLGLDKNDRCFGYKKIGLDKKGRFDTLATKINLRKR